MFSINRNSGAVVAEDTKASVNAIDAALLSNTRLCATILEASHASGLPINATQKLLQSMASGLNQLVAGRADMVATIRQLNLIQGQSDLSAVSYGCPDATKPTGQLSDDDSASASRAFA